jgi:NAD(P)H dehydrogenase (quinone)
VKIIVTGASGGFGGHAAAMLLEKVPPADLILLSRTPSKLAKFAAQGADVRRADFDDPTSLPVAFAGGDRLLLISTARVGTRVGQHRNAIDAAVAAGVGHIVYTSLLGATAEGNPAIVKNDHRATEEIIEASGAAWTFLRDSQYAEAVAGPMVMSALLSGAPKLDNCGDGRVAFVSRDDCVATAVAVLTQDGHANRAYDLTGPELFTIPQAMALAGEIAGHPIEVAATDDDGMFAYFDSLGVPRHASDIVPDGPIPWSSDDMVTFGQAIREGFFDRITDDVERITGRAPMSLRDVMLAHRASWPA